MLGGCGILNFATANNGHDNGASSHVASQRMSEFFKANLGDRLASLTPREVPARARCDETYEARSTSQISVTRECDPASGQEHDETAKPPPRRASATREANFRYAEKLLLDG